MALKSTWRVQMDIASKNTAIADAAHKVLITARGAAFDALPEAAIIESGDIAYQLVKGRWVTDGLGLPISTDFLRAQFVAGDYSVRDGSAA
jgi:hypothetical protein